MRRPAALLVIALVAALAAACGSSTATPSPASPTPAPSAASTPTPAATPVPSATPFGPQDAAAIYAAIEDDVVAMRGLLPRRPVDPQLIDEAELEDRLAGIFARDNAPERIAAQEGALTALGLLPADASYEELVLRLLGSQVAGFYDTASKELFVVSRAGAIGPVERVTFAHEFTHALQDQAFDLEGMGVDTPGQGDASLAGLSLVEGDASLVMSRWAQAELTPEELVEMVAASNEPETVRLLAEMPAILRDTLLFPYTAGLQFVMGVEARGGWAAVDRVYETPPVSTEQILHPDRYPAERPVEVDLPGDLAAAMGAGWRSALEDTLGELQLRIWLQTVPAASSGFDPLAAADGWAGDRLAYLEGPDGRWALALRTAWDSAADAAEFERGAAVVVDARDGPGAVVPGEGGTTRWVVFAREPADLERLANVLGLAG